MENGINEAVLPLSDAGQALLYFKQLGWLVLGGDVYVKSDAGGFKSTYENWYYEGDNVDESIDISASFLSGLSGRAVYVSFVVEGSP